VVYEPRVDFPHHRRDTLQEYLDLLLDSIIKGIAEQIKACSRILRDRVEQRMKAISKKHVK